MYTLLAALFSLAAAVPQPHNHHHHHHNHRRDVVWVSYTEVVTVTIPVTVTVWVDGDTAPEATPTTTYAPPEYEEPESSPTTYATPSAPPAYTPKTSPSSSSSIYIAPAPTTPTIVAPAPYVAPTPSSPPVYVAPVSSAEPATTPAASGQSVSGGVSGMAAAGKTYTGDLTWYDVGLGACGITNTKDQSVIAVPEAMFDAYSTGNPNTNPLCGKTITITGKDGTTYRGTVVDRCTGCKVDDLDLSQDFFNKVTSNGDGRVGGMSWCFEN